MTFSNKEGPFSDALFASDVDGTLNNKLRRLPKKNLEAIRRFSDTLGGNFTLASGRNIETLEPHYRTCCDGVPAVILNGAGIYDYTRKKLLDFTPVSAEGMDFICELCLRFPRFGIALYTDNKLCITGIKPFADILILSGKQTWGNYKRITDISKRNWGKVVFNGTKSDVIKLKNYFGSLTNPCVDIMESSPMSVEFLEKGVNKGTGVLKVADLLSVDHSRTYAIGDYFNDEEMLRAVGVSACCGQAPEALRAMVDYVACDCNGGAVADFLSYIERTAQLR